MRLALQVQPGDPLPLYQQLVRQLEAAIAGGRLAAGDKLPSHRDLALELVIAPLTVKKAYDLLEASGLLETRRGRGTFVAERPQGCNEQGARDRVRQRLKEAWREAQLLGLPLSSVVALLREARQEAIEEDRQGEQRRA